MNFLIPLLIKWYSDWWAIEKVFIVFRIKKLRLRIFPIYDNSSFSCWTISDRLCKTLLRPPVSLSDSTFKFSDPSDFSFILILSKQLAVMWKQLKGFRSKRGRGSVQVCFEPLYFSPLSFGPNFISSSQVKLKTLRKQSRLSTFYSTWQKTRVCR